MRCEIPRAGSDPRGVGDGIPAHQPDLLDQSQWRLAFASLVSLIGSGRILAWDRQSARHRSQRKAGAEAPFGRKKM